ncbi:hypothetical protein BCLUESOX_525 [bacterium endosymbiont of Bathymodiolus sp. 5 South]|nr:hypothetical protein BCLUESOX_525 [bacterium endosymbiont of Bathymodiolus sp. 5 South]
MDFANHPYLCKGLGLLYHLKACNCIFARFCQTCTTTPNYQS